MVVFFPATCKPRIPPVCKQSMMSFLSKMNESVSVSSGGVALKAE